MQNSLTFRETPLFRLFGDPRDSRGWVVSNFRGQLVKSPPELPPGSPPGAPAIIDRTSAQRAWEGLSPIVSSTRPGAPGSRPLCCPTCTRPQGYVQRCTYVYLHQGVIVVAYGGEFLEKTPRSRQRRAPAIIVSAYDVTKTRVERQATTPTPLVDSANITPLAY